MSEIVFISPRSELQRHPTAYSSPHPPLHDSPLNLSAKMRSSVIAYVLVALAVNVLAAPAPAIYRRDGGAGSDSQTGTAGPVNGGTITNSGGVVANGEDSGTFSSYAFV